jgi:hypothetical protein
VSSSDGSFIGVPRSSISSSISTFDRPATRFVADDKSRCLFGFGDRQLMEDNDLPSDSETIDESRFCSVDGAATFNKKCEVMRDLLEGCHNQ